MFLLHIIDITDKIYSTFCLFADDCLLYQKSNLHKRFKLIKRPQSVISLGFNMTDEIQYHQICSAWIL